MIRFRPHRSTLSASLKDEMLFDSVEEMISYVFDLWCRTALFIGAHHPPSRDEIFISEDGRRNPLVGYMEENRVLIPSLSGRMFRVPICVGYIDMEAIV